MPIAIIPTSIVKRLSRTQALPDLARQIIIALLSIYWLFLPYGQLLRLPTSWAEVHLYAGDIVVGLIGIIWVLGNQFTKFRSLFNLPGITGIVTILGIMSLSWFLNITAIQSSQFLPSIAYLIRWAAYVLLIPIIAHLQLNALERKHQIQIMFFSLIVFAITGLIQYFFIPDFHMFQITGWDNHLHRLAGTWLDPGYAGMFLVLGILLVMPLALGRLDIAQPFHPWAITWQLLLISLGLTFSRASYLACVVGIVVYHILTRRVFSFILICLYAAIIFLLLPRPAGEGVNLQRQSTVQFRLENWQQAITISKDNLWLGVGYNRYRYVQREYNFLPTSDWQVSHSAAGVDNSILFIIATTGILGLMAFTYFAFDLISSLFTASQDVIPRPAPNLVSLASHLPSIAIASLAAWIVHSQFHNTLFYTPIIVWCAAIISMALTVRTLR